MKRRGTGKTPATPTQYACQVRPCYESPAQRLKTKLPKKSAYYGPKQAAPLAQADHENSVDANKSNFNNSSNAANTAKSSSERNQPSPFAKNNSIFVATPRNYTKIAADVVRADCMNHGYRIEKTVGEGAYAKVKLAEVLPSKLARNPVMAEIAQGNDGVLQVAIKVIENKHVPKEFLRKFLPRELENHCPLAPHNNVVRVFEQFRTTERIYVVMEYCSKGDLLDLINQTISESCKGLGEELTRKLFRMMVEGLHHIHHNGIVHRDLKCENILLDSHDTIKITDFGFSTRFEHGKSSLLKTSCGSYAYTAPEVIKMKPYDGTKSDAWSLGIILFAMLNGRLPFNDAQLKDLEEDMKMQRLRFERTVSFESMVLVRRILQFNPTSRPTTDEILSDPWLTGKRVIPRQQNRPKWINPYQARKEGGDVDGPTVVGNNPVYYKGTIPERGPEATITVNHEKNETVVLKSRAGNKKNIWASGPTPAHRPNTWPRSETDKINGKSKPNRGSTASCSTSARGKHTKTTLIVRPPTTNAPKKKGHTGKGDTKARVSSQTIRMSKWFMERYMNSKNDQQKPDTNTECGCCKAEAALASNLAKTCEKDDTLEIEEDLCFVEHGTPVQYPDFEEVRFPSPVKNEKPERTNSADKMAAKPDTKPEQKTETSTKPETRNCSSASSSSICNRQTSTVTRKPAVKSANVRSGPTTKDTIKSPRTSRALDPATVKKCLVNYMVNRSTSPAERVKYFRDRLMKLYGNERIQQVGANGLPTLMVQALKPPTTQSSPPEPASQPQQTPYNRQRSSGASTLHARRGSSGKPVKPVQRVVVHSSML